MQSAIQKQSYGSVKVFWLNKKLLNRQIEDAAQKLLAERAEVKKVVLFGSFAEDRATVFSDVDILLVVQFSSKRFIDRPQDYIDYFRKIELSKDLKRYTTVELDGLLQERVDNNDISSETYDEVNKYLEMIDKAQL